MEEIVWLAQLIRESKKTIVFTGAGVSTESGIPDFRSPGGIWSKYNPEDFTIQKFLSGPAARKRIWKMSAESGLLTAAEPNPAHYAIAKLHNLGKLDCVITQNIDNLHQKAGVPEDRVLELHGNMEGVVCLGCRSRFPLLQILQKVGGNRSSRLPRLSGYSEARCSVLRRGTTAGCILRGCSPDTEMRPFYRRWLHSYRLPRC